MTFKLSDNTDDENTLCIFVIYDLKFAFTYNSFMNTSRYKIQTKGSGPLPMLAVSKKPYALVLDLSFISLGFKTVL